MRLQGISATAVRKVLRYESETGMFYHRSGGNGVSAGSVAGSLHNKGYIRIGVGGKQYFAHRLAWLYFYGEWPSSHIDHINQDKTDNRIANLRLATDSQNQANIFGRSSSGAKGVCAEGSRWKAQIMRGGKKLHLGTFDTPEEAHKAYCQAAGRFDGIYACTEHKNVRSSTHS